MRLIDADSLVYSRVRIAHEDGTIGGYNAVVMSSVINHAPTVEAIPVSWFRLLCKQLEDRCPPDRECIVSGYEGTCEECWKEWCRDVLNER